MRALVQRVSRAAVSVGGEPIAEIGPGLLVLLGIAREDGEAQAERLAEKVRALRVFEDPAGKMNEALGEREVLCVSQFTLYADTRKGNRPSFVDAAPPELAEPLYERFCERLGAARGRFGARMAVELVNDGPVTLLPTPIALDRRRLSCPGPRLYWAALLPHPHLLEQVGPGPPFFGSRACGGSPEIHTMPELQEKIENRLADTEPDVELIALERPTPDGLRLFIDRPAGVDLELCERVTHHLRDLLQHYSLEVSSPGLDRPLTKPEHFRRFLGRRVRVRTRNAIEGQRSFTGRLTAADERAVRIEAGAGPVEIPLAGIRRSNLVPELGEGE